MIGGGYIGLELGSVWPRLGGEVTVVEYLDRILPGMDRELGQALQRVLARAGHRVHASATQGRRRRRSATTAVTLELEPAAGGERESLAADIVLVAVGRRPFTEGLGLDELGVELDGGGRIAVDDDFATNVAGIYAIGDVIARPDAGAQGRGGGHRRRRAHRRPAAHVNYDAIPGVVYTWPEVAAVGKTEDELKRARASSTASASSRSSPTAAPAPSADTDGFVKVLADAKTDRVLGVHIIGPRAGR